MPEFHWLKYPGRVGDATLVPAVAASDLLAGQLVHISGNGAVDESDRTDLSTIHVLGACVAGAAIGGSIDIQTSGAISLLFDAGLALVAGDPIYLSENGRATNIPPTTPGEALVEVGELLDVGSYGPGSPYATVVIEVEEPVILS